MHHVAETTRQIIQENPEIEAYRLGLLRDTTDFIRQQLGDGGIMPPAYQVAGLSPAQQQAMQMAQSGIGMYQPFLQSGLNRLRQGQSYGEQFGFGGLQEAFGATREGQRALSQAAQVAAQNRLQPYEYQRAAAQGINTALGGAYNQAASSQQDFANVAGQARNYSQAARGDINQAIQNQYNTALQGQQGLAGAAGQAQAGLDAAAGQAGGVYGQAQDLFGTNRDLALQQAAQSQEELRNAAQGAQQGAQTGFDYLTGSGAQFDPQDTQRFMNPYEDQAVQQALRDIRREGDIREQGLQAQAANVGAFGGSRQAVAEQELGRNIMEQQGRTAAQMRNQGYQQAAQQAQSSFEDAKRRQQQQASLSGTLGSTASNAALQAAQAGGQLGMQALGLGQQAGQAQTQAGMQAAQQAQQAAQMGGQFGMNAAMQGAQLGMQAGQAAQQGGLQAGQLGMQGAQLAGQMAQAGGNIGMQGAQMGMQGAQQLGQLGLGYGQLAQGDANQLMQIGQASAQMGQGLGSLAQAGMGMGSQLGQMGLQEAGLGQMYQNQHLQDIKLLEALGGRDQQMQQAILDAQRQSNLQMQQFPYQQLAFLSDIYKGTPSSQQVTQISQQQQPSAAQQIGGLGIAALSGLGGAKQMGLFG